MKNSFLIILMSISLLSLKQDDFCKYDSLLEFQEDEAIKYKQVTKLNYYNQGSKFAIRRDYGEIDLVFSSLYNLENKNFESLTDRDQLQSNFNKNDYIIRIQFQLLNAKLEVKNYEIDPELGDSLKCEVRLYHLDKTSQGIKVVSRKFSVLKGSLDIEKISTGSFCGSINLEVSAYYNLKSTFSVSTVSKDN